MTTIYVDTKHLDERADSYICSNFQVHSRSFLADHWEELVSINGKKAKPSYKLKAGDEITIRDEKVNQLLADISYDKINPQESPLQIIYECDSYLVLNKPKGVPVHPGVGNYKDTLANYVAGYLMKTSKYDPTIDRAGVVHRLDKPVSGLIVFAKNNQTQKYLQKQFEMHKVQKIYHAKLF
jgi:23S rRNA pseudouridine1911/1915/1917 synthase